MKGDWKTCLAQWERIAKYSLPILCRLRDSIPERSKSGLIKEMDIHKDERGQVTGPIKVVMTEDGENDDTVLKITSDDMFFMTGGRDSKGRTVFVSEEFNE